MPSLRWNLSLLAVLVIAFPASLFAALPTDPLVGLTNGNGKTAAGSKPSPDPQTPQSILADLHTKLSAAEKELKEAEAIVKQESAPSGETLERRALLQRLVRAYEREIDHRKSLEQAGERRQEAERRVTEWQGFPTPPPYSILMLDELRDAARSTALVIEGLQAKLALTDGFSERAQQTLAASEKDLRQASERLEAARDPAEKARLNKARDLSRLRNRAAAATATMTAANKRQIEEEAAEMRQRALLLERQIQTAAQHVVFGEQDLAKIKKQLDADQTTLENEVSRALAEHPLRQEAMAAAAATLRAAEAALPPAGARTDQRTAEIKDLADAADLTRLQFDNVNLRIDMLRHLLDVTERVRRFWEIRFEAAQTTDPVRSREAYDKIAPTLQTLQASRNYLHRQVDLLTGQISDVTAQLEQPASPSHAAHLREKVEAYRQREQLYRRMLPRIDEFAQLIERWKIEFAEQHRGLPIAARVEDWRVVGADMLHRVWEFELFAAEDTIEVDGQSITGRRSVTVGKAVRALAILIVGYWICLVIARLVERLAVKRLGIDHNLANILRQWMMVLLFAILLIVSLIYVKIPLTVFAFLGGALAIGVGFGTQTLLKNFISGILLLIERPLRLGDLIEVDGVRGRVTHIGFRSSTIREGNGMEMLIPNSNLLEKNLNNWTYSTARTRFTLRVGVAYESPTDQVRDLLLEEANRHGLVLKHPEPQVLFRDFGDNTLLFDLRFWLDIAADVDSDVVASDLRFMIAKDFAEAGIVFAFPQRDVHLKTVQPLPVQVVHPPPETGTAGLER
ncbi:putative Mechanosensitive ion channel family protein [Nitrospira japonica]|uniref:Putative Mechanosensitive ion channel family protein n=1 Tax=Nitrospira japonica TaxID=1325564 RepID=A0A1W1I0I3_9BACT|nr:mechanosensitive ion channel domain-containing protein [Nitrospira japonica]SLM46487.1 putative Mechanosensitive ion channel family protein [Nitrospira japonica]